MCYNKNVLSPFLNVSKYEVNKRTQKHCKYTFNDGCIIFVNKEAKKRVNV